MIKPPNPNVLSGGLIGLIMSLCHVFCARNPGHTTSVPQVQIEVVYEKVG